MSETLSNGGGETVEQGGGKNEWEQMAENAPQFNPEGSSDVDWDSLEKMPLDTNEQQADYLDAEMKMVYIDSYHDGDENFDKRESYPESQRALLSRELISELREELKNPNNLGKTFYDLLRARLQQVQQSEHDFKVTGPDNTWSEDDFARRQFLIEQREALTGMADTIKDATLLRGELGLEAKQQENFKESYCLRKREIEGNRLQNVVEHKKEEIAEINNNSALSDAARERKIAEVKNEIEDAYYNIDNIEQENDILRDALLRKSEGQSTDEVLRSDADAVERSVAYYKGLMDSAKTESSKQGFRRSYREARNKLKRINAVISDLDEAEHKNVRLG